MCKKCFNTCHHGFESKYDFVDFNLLLDDKILEGFLEVSKERNTYKHVMYKILECSNCHKKWCLSEPSHSWNGFLLEMDEALSFIDEAVKKSRRKALLYGGISVLFIITLVYLYIHYQLN